MPVAQPFPRPRRPAVSRRSGRLGPRREPRAQASTSSTDPARGPGPPAGGRRPAGPGGGPGPAPGRTASTSVATTVAHTAGGGEATSTSRSRATPNPAAAASPTVGSPTAAAHDPAADGPASRARASEVVPGPPSTATVTPRRRPRTPSGSRPAEGVGQDGQHPLVGPGDRSGPGDDLAATLESPHRGTLALRPIRTPSLSNTCSTWQASVAGKCSAERQGNRPRAAMASATRSTARAKAARRSDTLSGSRLGPHRR